MQIQEGSDALACEPRGVDRRAQPLWIANGL